jgi:hypothetical protein
MNRMFDEYTPAQIMVAISAALRDNDMEAAAALIQCLAVKDPAAAQMIVDAVELLR